MEVLYIHRLLKSTLDTKVGYKALNTETALIHPKEKPRMERDNTQTPPKPSITQRLRTDLGRSVRVTFATHWCG